MTPPALGEQLQALRDFAKQLPDDVELNIEINLHQLKPEQVHAALEAAGGLAAADPITHDFIRVRLGPGVRLVLFPADAAEQTLTSPVTARLAEEQAALKHAS